MMKEGNITGFTLEGECYVGKSSTLREVAVVAEQVGKQVFVIPEYFEIGNLSDTSRRDFSDVKRIQNEIVDLEKRRTEMAVDQMANNPELILGFDRSFLTCVAYELSMQKQGEMDGLEYLLERYVQEFQLGNILLPAQVAHLVAEPAEIANRRTKHLKKGHGDVSAFLKDTLVIQVHNDFYRKAGNQIYGESYIKLPVDGKNLRDVAQDVFSWVRTGIGTQSFDINKLYEIVA